jgi:Type IV secretion system pilin
MSLIPQVLAAAGTIGVPQPTGMKITDIGVLISRVISLAFIVAGILTFAFLVMGGIEWLTSGGDKGKTENARNRITAAVVGLAIVAASWALMKLIAYFFGVDVFEGNINIPKPY